jgi:hypothetical protein
MQHSLEVDATMMEQDDREPATTEPDTTNSAPRSRRRRRRRGSRSARNAQRTQGQRPDGSHGSAGASTHEPAFDQPSGPELTLDEALVRIDPCELFGAFYLGLTADDRYKLGTIRDVARRFSTKPAIIETLLAHFAMDGDAIARARFNVNLARLDLEVAPEGISRREITRQHFDEFRDLQNKATARAS